MHVAFYSYRPLCLRRRLTTIGVYYPGHQQIAPYSLPCSPLWSCMTNWPGSFLPEKPISVSIRRIDIMKNPQIRGRRGVACPSFRRCLIKRISIVFENLSCRIATTAASPVEGALTRRARRYVYIAIIVLATIVLVTAVIVVTSKNLELFGRLRSGAW